MTPEFFLEEFSTIANAPGGVTRLKEMIFQLAIQGKLVRQKPEDGSVDLLIKNIEAEKKLSGTKARGKTKNTYPIKEEEKYLDLPSSWRWVRLQTLGNIFNGNSVNAKVKEEKYSGKTEGLTYIATKDVKYGFASLNYDNGIKIPIDEPKFKVAHKGSVLICSEGGSAGKKCGITHRDICFGNKLFAIELFGGLVSKFFLSLYLSPSFNAQFQTRMTGIIGGISSANFSSIPIPLPPLAEQKRIVAKIDLLLPLCDKLEQQQQKRTTLIADTRASALEALSIDESISDNAAAWKRVKKNLSLFFEKPEDVEDLKKCILQNAVLGKLVPGVMFKQVELKNVISFGPKNGFSPKGVDFETSVKVFTLSATTKGIVDLSKFKYAQINVESDSHLWLEVGDILIQRGNSPKYVGVSAIYNGPEKEYIYPDLMMKIKALPNVITSDLLYISLSAPLARKHMWAKLSGTSSTMPKINQKVVNSIPINLPPFAEQDRIVSKTYSLLRLCETLQKQLVQSCAIADQLAQSVVENLTGISTEKKETMKAPKTELITKLVLAKTPNSKDQAPLSSILSRNNKSLSAKKLWNASGLNIDDFYKQLKTEMISGWIEEPEKAEVRIIDEKTSEI